MLKGLTAAEADACLDDWKEAVLSGDIYGFGLSRGLFIEAPPHRDADFILKGVFDNNELFHGRSVLGFDVLPPAEIKNRRGKIVVFAHDYGSVRDQLNALGLTERQDFIRREDYWTLLSFIKFEKIFVGQTWPLPVTDRCTLRCAHCGTASPYAARPADAPLEKLAADLASFFTVADSLMALCLQGGEPMLHPGLPDIVHHVGENYRGRIARIVIVTNGTVRPSAELLAASRLYDVQFEISDYSGCGIPGYEKKLAATLAALAAAGHPPRRLRRDPWWRTDLDQADLDRLAALNEAGMRVHYAACWSRCAQAEDGRYRYCGRLERDEGFPFPAARPISHEDRLGWVRRFLGFQAEGFYQACRACHSGLISPPEIPRAGQIKE